MSKRAVQIKEDGIHVDASMDAEKLPPARLPSVGEAWTYNEYVTPNEHALTGYDEASALVKRIVREFVNQRKIIASFDLAKHLVKERFPRATDDDIIEAWAIGAGGGCEFEWPME